MKRAALLAALGLALTSCGSVTQTPVQQHAEFEANEMADMQSRLRSFCDEHGNRIYWISGRSSQFGVAVQDPTCRSAP